MDGLQGYLVARTESFGAGPAIIPDVDVPLSYLTTHHRIQIYQLNDPAFAATSSRGGSSGGGTFTELKHSTVH